MVLATLFAVAMLAAPGSLASADTVKIYYQDVHDIQVDFPNGKEIRSGGELIIVTSSNVYDMEKSGIMFYRCDSSGAPDRTTTITPDHYSVLEDNVVTHVFSNLTTNIEMDFTELVKLDSQQIAPNEPSVKNKDTAGDNTLTAIVLLLSVILAAVMLTIMAAVIRMLNSTIKQDVTS